MIGSFLMFKRVSFNIKRQLRFNAIRLHDIGTRIFLFSFTHNDEDVLVLDLCSATDMYLQSDVSALRDVVRNGIYGRVTVDLDDNALPFSNDRHLVPCG